MSNNSNKKKHAASARVILLPFVIAIFVMHFVIVGNSIRINRMGEAVTEATQRMFTFEKMSGDYAKGAELLEEKARTYAVDGSISAVKNYMGQLAGTEGIGNALLTMMEQCGFEYAADKMQASMDALAKRTDTEQYAISLAAEYWDTDLRKEALFQTVDLSQEHLNSNEPQNALAMAMLFEESYQQKRRELVRDLEISVNMAIEDTKEYISTESKILVSSRRIQAGLTVAVVALLLLLCYLTDIWLLRPLTEGVRLVHEGKAVSTEKGFREIRRLAKSYNELLDSRNELEDYLKKQSHTDALTGLQNRLALQEYVDRFEKDARNEAVTVFSMDLNCLKEINDKQGHVFGDLLLRNAAECIRSAFDDGTGMNCFRFGGDEFAAIWIGKKQTDIENAMITFQKEQERRGVSISTGYEYTDQLSKTSMEALFECADQKMYENKAAFKKQEKNMGVLNG